MKSLCDTSKKLFLLIPYKCKDINYYRIRESNFIIWTFKINFTRVSIINRDIEVNWKWLLMVLPSHEIIWFFFIWSVHKEFSSRLYETLYLSLSAGNAGIFPRISLKLGVQSDNQLILGLHFFYVNE